MLSLHNEISSSATKKILPIRSGMYKSSNIIPGLRKSGKDHYRWTLVRPWPLLYDVVQGNMRSSADLTTADEGLQKSKSARQRSKCGSATFATP